MPLRVRSGSYGLQNSRRDRVAGILFADMGVRPLGTLPLHDAKRLEEIAKKLLPKYTPEKSGAQPFWTDQLLHSVWFVVDLVDAAAKAGLFPRETMKKFEELTKDVIELTNNVVVY